ncbi:hypothetical protein JTE90_019004 [Oedothorax gibbosus]|uniref:Rab-GAP TBC domain-containing protein n=1 Tax=Oedothorax gibbosus TaxID=931172 RepID=A0AAV6UXF0_9ARAC|nr:hypothetical protein JTE90_019004 [Oedothorax gibbosus]
MADSLVRFKNVYCQEFINTFNAEYYLEDMHKLARTGFLKYSPFRSVCWRLFLKELPGEKKLWLDQVTQQRQHYSELKIRHYTDPRLTTWEDDDPLSTAEMSQWNQFFEDKELQLEIHQDVVRTFPDQELFRDIDIQEIMVQILFIFVRTHPKMQYKQGMHELLAPIIYVLKSDINQFKIAEGEGATPTACSYLLMDQYIEEDSYTMFVKVMDIVASWYMMDTDRMDTDGFEKNEELQNNGELPADTLNSVLQEIWGHFKVYDQEVYDHLNNLEIPPQIYGMRWLKLLFGREFHFEDVFLIWDIILSDSVQRNIHVYIFISMLISIRHLLLNSDYTSCVSHLMKFPRVENVQYIIDLAFHLRNPAEYRRPEKSSTSYAALFKAKEEKTKVNTIFSSSVGLGSSSSGKNCATRPKTVDINPEKTSFFFKKGQVSSRAEESSLGVECSEDSCDFSEPSQGFISLPSYGIPRTSIRDVMGIATQTQRASEFIKLQGSSNDDKKTLESRSREMEIIFAPLIQSDAYSRFCSSVPSVEIEQMKDVVNNTTFDGAPKIIDALQELETIKFLLEDTYPHFSESLSDRASEPSLVQDVASILVKETGGSANEEFIQAKETF